MEGRVTAEIDEPARSSNCPSSSRCLSRRFASRVACTSPDRLCSSVNRSISCGAVTERAERANSGTPMSLIRASCFNEYPTEIVGFERRRARDNVVIASSDHGTDWLNLLEEITQRRNGIRHDLLRVGAQVGASKRPP